MLTKKQFKKLYDKAISRLFDIQLARGTVTVIYDAQYHNERFYIAPIEISDDKIGEYIFDYPEIKEEGYPVWGEKGQRAEAKQMPPEEAAALLRQYWQDYYGGK